MRIKLYDNGRAVSDGEIHTICDNESLVIDIEAEADNLYAVCSYNDKRTVVKVEDSKIEIPPERLVAGQFLVTLQQVENGEVIKRWKTERITLRELKDGYEAIPEIAELWKELATTKMALRELYGLINKNNQI